MDAPAATEIVGRVASLHLHPPRPGDPLHTVAALEVVAAKGILGNPRYFDRQHPPTGEPNPRQVTLIEREQIAAHAVALGLQTIPPGAVRANIETLGLQLVPLVGYWVQVGDSVLLFHAARKPCSRMDAVCQGLRALMEPDRQGVLAQVVRSGMIRTGDVIRLLQRAQDEHPRVSSP